ncbi:MAG: hypothetical protein ACK56A_06625 [Bacteroidota bacterium]
MPPSIADHRVSERQHPSNTFPLVSKRQHPSIFDTRVSIDPILTSVSEPIRRK